MVLVSSVDVKMLRESLLVNCNTGNIDDLGYTLLNENRKLVLLVKEIVVGVCEPWSLRRIEPL